MEHIRQYDWYSSEPDGDFVKEADLDKCVTEKILRNKFNDPLISSESEDDNHPKIDWSQVFNKRNNSEKQHHVFAAGLRALPPFPKLSALNINQHLQCLKVLCAENPTILEREYMGRPTKMDYRVFEEVKSTYLIEQQEYIQWAKTLWTTDQCRRALRPKPSIEMVYDAEFKLKAKEMESFPKKYEVAAQISLDAKAERCEMTHQKDLVKVKLQDLPHIQYPDLGAKRFSVMRPCAVPEACVKHPCRFVLPNETTMSLLPLTEIQRELAQYALDHEAQHIASEAALRCLVELDRQWTLPLSVFHVVTADGDKKPVLVLGSDFAMSRPAATTRTYRAFRHLVTYAFIPPLEKAKLLPSNSTDEPPDEPVDRLSEDVDELDVSSDEEDQLVIDAGDDEEQTGQPDQPSNTRQETLSTDSPPKTNESEKESSNKYMDKDKYYNCTCKDTVFEKPPPRSFRRWQMKNLSTKDKYNLIVHCSHKAKGRAGEVILEPIPEYQIDVGGSRQSPDKIRGLMLSLFLRRNAALLNVRVDCATGDVVTVEQATVEEWSSQHSAASELPALCGGIHAALAQLLALLPGHYVLHHEPHHGANALLYVPKPTPSGDALELRFEHSDVDEAKSVLVAPNLAPVLLPAHKFRKILPCAFTPFANQLARDQKKPPFRQKTPPQAIKWPKRNLRKRKKPS